MRRSRVALLGVLLLLFAGSAFADSTSGGDPHVIIGGGGSQPSGGADGTFIRFTNFEIDTLTGTSPGTSPCMLTQNGVTISVPDCQFENATGIHWSILTFILIGNTNPGPFNCAVTNGGFGDCLFSADGTEVTFFGGHGIDSGKGQENDDADISLAGFSPNTGFAGTASTPEPATLTLILGGLGALAGRRLRKSKKNAL